MLATQNVHLPFFTPSPVELPPSCMNKPELNFHLWLLLYLLPSGQRSPGVRQKGWTDVQADLQKQKGQEGSPWHAAHTHASLNLSLFSVFKHRQVFCFFFFFFYLFHLPYLLSWVLSTHCPSVHLHHWSQPQTKIRNPHFVTISTQFSLWLWCRGCGRDSVLTPLPPSGS